MDKRIIDDITRFVFINDEIERADIIFIPGGSHPELGEYAATLYKQGYADFVMPTGGVSIKTGKFGGVKAREKIYDKEYTTDCEFLSDVLIKNGVPDEAIIREDKSGFTKENAYFARKMTDMKNIRVNTAIICCKNFHARRSLMCFQFAFPETVFYVHPVPFVDGGTEISAENWHTTEKGVNRVLGELQRYGTQFNEEFMSIT